jgi:hypothetical protein
MELIELGVFLVEAVEQLVSPALTFGQRHPHAWERFVGKGTITTNKNETWLPLTLHKSEQLEKGAVVYR